MVLAPATSTTRPWAPVHTNLRPLVPHCQTISRTPAAHLACSAQIILALSYTNNELPRTLLRACDRQQQSPLGQAPVEVRGQGQGLWLCVEFHRRCVPVWWRCCSHCWHVAWCVLIGAGSSSPLLLLSSCANGGALQGMFCPQCSARSPALFIMSPHLRPAVPSNRVGQIRFRSSVCT